MTMGGTLCSAWMTEEHAILSDLAADFIPRDKAPHFARGRKQGEMEKSTWVGARE